MSEKGKSILAYVFTWVGGLIVLYGMKDNQRNTKLHAAQAIVIGLGYMVIVMVYRILPISIPFFSTLLYGLYAVLVILGIVKANNEDDPELPVVSDIAKSIFGKKIDEPVAQKFEQEEPKNEEPKNEEPKNDEPKND